MKSNSPDSKKEKRHQKFADYVDGKKVNEDKPQNMLETGKKLLSIIANKKGLIVFIIIVSILSTVLSLLGPVYLGDIIDNITSLIKVKLLGQTLDFDGIKKILLTVIAIYFGSSVTGFLQQYLMAGLNRDLIFTLRKRLNIKLSALPLRFFDSNKKGDILSRVTNDIDNIQNSFQNNIIQIITSVVSVVGVFTIMMFISPLMTFFSVIVLPFGLVVALFILKASRRYFRENWKTMGDLNGHIEEMYTGHKIVKIFSHTQQACDEFTEINNDLCNIGMKAQFLSGALMPVIDFTSNIGYILICVLGGIMILKGKISIGDMTVFFVYSKLFMQPIVDISRIANNLQSSLASAERVFDILETQSEVQDCNNIHLPENGHRIIEIENVDFSYSEDKPLIENLNLTVKPGQLVALVGPTGAGKTTIVNLLMRFYDVNSGSIKIDGIDIRDISRNELRKTFGMVLQDTWLFEGTVKDNIAYGRDNASFKEIVQASNAARADKFISSLPEGYDTVLEEDATNISQGQRQLITIARAFLADPKILILDEATSSVDTRTELLIQNGMKTLMQGRTNFVIAHRLSTIRSADVILVMKEGRIIETGNHYSLMEKGGFYKELYEAQFDGK